MVSSVVGEGGRIDEAPQPEIALELGHALLPLVFVEVGLHVRHLDVALGVVVVRGSGDGMG